MASLIIELGVDELLSRYSFHPRMKAELSNILKGNLSKVLSQTRVSLKRSALKTQERRLYSIFRTIEEVRELGYKIESPYSLSGKHFEAVVKYWIADGQSIGTMQTKLSHLKAFCSWMGKHGLVRSLYEYVPKSDLVEKGLTRTYVTTTDKSWEAHGISASDKIAEIEKEDPYVATQLKLQAAFGMRIEESFSLQIEKAIRDYIRRGDGRILVDKGTKGGREREVPVQLQLQVLKDALKYVNSRTGSTTPDGYTIKRWRDRYNWIMRKHGITKNGLGITSHGLRHQWVQELYKTLTGHDAPIKGSEDRPDHATHVAAMKQTIEAVGHSRIDKAGAYMSTPAAMAKRNTKSVGISDAKRAVEESGGDKTAAAEKLGISRTRLYRLLGAEY